MKTQQLASAWQARPATLANLPPTPCLPGGLQFQTPVLAAGRAASATPVAGSAPAAVNSAQKQVEPALPAVRRPFKLPALRPPPKAPAPQPAAVPRGDEQGSKAGSAKAACADHTPRAAAAELPPGPQRVKLPGLLRKRKPEAVPAPLPQQDKATACGTDAGKSGAAGMVAEAAPGSSAGPAQPSRNATDAAPTSPAPTAARPPVPATAAPTAALPAVPAAAAPAAAATAGRRVQRLPAVLPESLPPPEPAASLPAATQLLSEPQA